MPHFLPNTPQHASTERTRQKEDGDGCECARWLADAHNDVTRRSPCMSMTQGEQTQSRQAAEGERVAQHSACRLVQRPRVWSGRTFEEVSAAILEHFWPRIEAVRMLLAPVLSAKRNSSTVSAQHEEAQPTASRQRGEIVAAADLPLGCEARACNSRHEGNVESGPPRADSERVDERELVGRDQEWSDAQ